MKRNVIPGLSKVDWSDGARQNEFVWSVISALGALGELLDYDYVAAISGSCFRTSFSKEGFNHGNYHICHALWAVEHTFKMLGYQASVRRRSDFQTDRSQIMAGIDNGVPAITLEGVINCSDACVISGYDNNGEVLLGYNPFMYIPDDHNEPHDETGYFRKSDWHNGFFAKGGGGYIITIGGNFAKPSEEEIFLETLKLAVRLIRTKEVNERGEQHNGLAAHTAFAQALLAREWSDNFEPYLNVMCNMKMVSDKKFAPGFFRAREKGNLAAIYDEIGKLRNRLGLIIPEDFSASDRFSDPKILQEYAEILLQIRDLEAEAADEMEKELRGKNE